MKPFLLLLQLKTFQVKLRMKLWSEKLSTVNFYFIFFNITGMVEDNRIDPKMVFSYVQEVYRMCNDLWTVLCSTYVHISHYCPLYNTISNCTNIMINNDSTRKNLSSPPTCVSYFWWRCSCRNLTPHYYCSLLSLSSDKQLGLGTRGWMIITSS